MSIRILKKALGLLIVDIVIIIGIFVLQFRTDSNIIMKIGNLQLTLESQEEIDGVIIYKNKVRLSYNGINFFCDDTNPAYATKAGQKVAVSFTGVEQKEPLSYTCSLIAALLEKAVFAQGCNQVEDDITSISYVRPSGKSIIELIDSALAWA